MRVWVLCSSRWLHPSISSYSSWITRLQLPEAPHAWQLQSRPQHWRFCSNATWRHLKINTFMLILVLDYLIPFIPLLITLSHFLAILSTIQTGNKWQRTASIWIILLFSRNHSRRLLLKFKDESRGTSRWSSRKWPTSPIDHCVRLQVLKRKERQLFLFTFVQTFDSKWFPANSEEFVKSSP